MVDWDSNRGCWQNSIPGEEAEPEKGEESPGLPPIAITDLATFAPAEGRIVGEPDSLGVVGLPANFVTEASPHVRSGDLFGFPVDVRFTPVSYTFDYGDGETRTSSSPGASWASLGQAQFTPTDTSHTYSERGTYDARVDIAYAAEIDLGAGWFPVEGQLDIPGPTQQIRIFEAHTALVARTCAEQPTAPGC
ncbi:PKD domain-containing protein [Microbacterium sp. NPDC089321]|uniref:PKD domain-containing protein n=1 Tax=Microbacterium sp. NPDC089321 TaxID=3155183 RepID=UPI003420134C